MPKFSTRVRRKDSEEVWDLGDSDGWPFHTSPDLALKEINENPQGMFAKLREYGTGHYRVEIIDENERVHRAVECLCTTDEQGVNRDSIMNVPLDKL